jgi:hypothetical protein
MHDDTPAAVMEWALRWEGVLHGRGVADVLREVAPLAISGAEVTARHVLRDGEFAAQEFTLSLKRPFEVDWQVQPWMPLLLTRCDGKKRVSELYEQSKEAGWIVAETPFEEFCGLVGNLISGGFLQVRDFQWPQT